MTDSDCQSDTLILRDLGIQDYISTWQAMQAFTQQRDAQTKDEVWLLQHPPVFTQGQAGKPEHLLNPGDIPVVQVDRGGQVTYHGPGQLIAYVLIDLKRRRLGVRELVTAIERVLVATLGHWQIAAAPRAEAPGVYVLDEAGQPAAKIAQLGLRVRRGCSFHGLSLNVDMNMEPFLRINPCGYAGQAVTSVAMELEAENYPSEGKSANIAELALALKQQMAADLGYTKLIERQEVWQP